MKNSSGCEEDKPTKKWAINKKTTVGFGIALFFLLGNGIFSYINYQNFKRVYTLTELTQAIIKTNRKLFMLMVQAETGQRGYLLTNNEFYLKPYYSAVQQVPWEIDDLRELTQDNPQQLERIEALENSVAVKLAELKHSIDLRREEGLNAALEVVNTDAGQKLMDDIRRQIQEIAEQEDALLEERSEHLLATSQTGTYLNIFGSVVVLLFVLKAIDLINKDTIEQKRAQEERELLLSREQEARQEAEAANRIKDEFLAVLSHELRTPLNPILGWSQLLRGSKFNQEMLSKGLETIERNVSVQIQLIDDLLDVARILQGKLLLNKAPTNLAAIVSAAVETVRLNASTKSITLETFIDPNLAVAQIEGDAARLQQVVWNLAANAVKFTPARGKVQIRAERIEGMALIQVIDTGKGISPDFLPHVFERFRQADSSITRTFGGLGLGLAIVHQIVELHGGTVSAQSPGLGMGATFTVKLPLSSVPSFKAPPDTKSLDLVPNLEGLQILVVDDDPSTRDFLTFALQEYGATVTTAACASEALSALSERKFNLLLSDIGMPEMDGYTFLNKIRSSFPKNGDEMPAIALTAYASEPDRQLALKAGFQSHIVKPVNLNELFRSIATLTKNF